MKEYLQTYAYFGKILKILMVKYSWKKQDNESNLHSHLTLKEENILLIEVM